MATNNTKLVRGSMSQTIGTGRSTRRNVRNMKKKSLQSISIAKELPSLQSTNFFSDDILGHVTKPHSFSMYSTDEEVNADEITSLEKPSIPVEQNFYPYNQIPNQISKM